MSYEWLADLCLGLKVAYVVSLMAVAPCQCLALLVVYVLHFCSHIAIGLGWSTWWRGFPCSEYSTIQSGESR